MNKDRVEIQTLATGVPGLDRVLGGGLPEYSFNLIAGAPGVGKTTLAQQIAFANATPERPALYFTVVGEPALKILRYQQQFAFFEPSRIGRDVHLLNLADEVLQGDMDGVLQRIVREVEQTGPGVVMVDSFRTVATAVSDTSAGRIEHFVQRLALYLTTWEITSFLVGEYFQHESRHPVFTVADGILWLSSDARGAMPVRRLEVVKMRGQAPVPGRHAFRIDGSGLRIFPRTIERRERKHTPEQRLGTGLPSLDQMMGAGVPAASSVLLAGPAGSGKTTFALHFLAEAQRAGEAAVLAIFEEHPADVLARARRLGVDLQAMIDEGRLAILWLRPLDLSVDEALFELQELMDRTGAKRLVIDSLSGFEITLSPPSKEEWREALYRLVATVIDREATVLMTLQASHPPALFEGGQYPVAFLADVVVVQHFIEAEGELRAVMAVVKMRGSRHSRTLRTYTIGEQGAVMGAEIQGQQHLLYGTQAPLPWQERTGLPGLTPRETMALDALLALGEAEAAEIARHAGLPLAEASDALQRLVATQRAERASSAEPPRFRALPQSSRR